MLLQHSGSAIQGTKHPSALPSSSDGVAEIRSAQLYCVARASPDRLQTACPVSG